MDETVVGDDIRHGENPAVAGFGQDVAPGAGQGTARSDERFVHPVHPPHHGPGPGQVEFGLRRARQHSGLRAGGGQIADRGSVDDHVRVQVDARKGHTLGVAEAQRVGLARRLGLDHADAVHLPRRRGSAVGAGVGDDDDVELTRSTAGEKTPQIAPDDRFLVVRRNDDADYGGVAHADRIGAAAAGTAPPIGPATTDGEPATDE
jgi:hypothetical protein